MLEIFSPDFVLRNTVLASILLGATVPPVGVVLVLWRRAMLGLVLPQVSKFGVAAGIGVAALCGQSAQETGETTFVAEALLGSLIAMGGALGLLTWLDWQGKSEGNSSAIYVLAYAAMIAITASNLLPELGLLNSLRGEIVTVSSSILAISTASLSFVLLAIFGLRHLLHAVLYDSWLAWTSGIPARLLSTSALVLICTAVAFGSLCADPLAIFAFLILPPLAVLPHVQRLPLLYAFSAILGVVSGLAGFAISYKFERLNIPVSAAQILMMGSFWIVSVALGKIRLLKLRLA